MMFKRFFLLLTLSLFAPALWAGGRAPAVELPQSQSKMAVLSEDDNSVVFREYDGSIVTIPKNPVRTVVCLNSLLDLWYMSGGEAIARVKGSINVPDEALDIVDLGSFSKVNMETLMELEPDFIIFSDSQKKQRDFFKAEGVPVVSINYTNYDDFRVVLDLFTRITGERELYKGQLSQIQNQVQSVIDQVPQGEGPSICILFATTDYVKVETQNTVAGRNFQLLGARNIYEENLIEGASRVDLSLEYILEQDPDIIFATTMGDLDQCREHLESEIFNSEIWNDLTAVKNGRFYILDNSYSIYKPNRFYPEAFRIEAEFLYPDTVFSIKGNP